jgi:hypothetical protein
MLRDRYDCELSTTSLAARDAYVTGCDLLLSANPGGELLFERAIAEDEAFLLGHAALARSLQGIGRPQDGKACLARAQHLVSRATDREKSQFSIVENLLDGRSTVALEEIYRHVQSWPRDAMALAPATGVFGLIGFSGKTGREQAQLEMLQPLAIHYGNDWWFLGALAFSEIEQGLLDVGRAHVEMSLRGNSRNANAAHVSAHGYYESGDVSDGIRFLRDWLKAYSVGSPLHCHLHWHLALWALQNGNLDDAWSIYHASLRPGVCIGPQINRLTDSASFLFRAELAGEPSDDTLWREVSDLAAELFPDAGIAFVDIHAALAHAMAGNGDLLARLTEHPKGLTGDLVASASRAFSAFARQDWQGVLSELQPVLGEHERLGGSRAQRDIIEYTMACALMKSGREDETKRLLYSRRGRALVGGIPIAGVV